MGNECENCENVESKEKSRDRLITEYNLITEQTPDKNITSQKLLQSIAKPSNQ